MIKEFQHKFKSLAAEGLEDLLQECLTHWFFVKDKYRSEREVTLKTFMRRVLENKLRDILEEKETDKRKVFHKSISLDDLTREEGAELVERFFGVGGGAFASFLKSEFPSALLKAFEKLTLKQRELCSLLGEKGLNIKQASGYLGIPRSTLREEIKRIREIFREEGLEDYLA